MHFNSAISFGVFVISACLLIAKADDPVNATAAATTTTKSVTTAVAATAAATNSTGPSGNVTTVAGPTTKLSQTTAKTGGGNALGLTTVQFLIIPLTSVILVSPILG